MAFEEDESISPGPSKVQSNNTSDTNNKSLTNDQHADNRNSKLFQMSNFNGTVKIEEDCSPETAAKIITEQLRLICRTPKKIRNTEKFVKDVRKELTFLHHVRSTYMQNNCKQRRRCPVSADLQDLLIRYVELEYDALYRSYSKSKEVVVQDRILTLLERMLKSTPWNMSTGSSSAPLFILKKVHYEYMSDDKLVMNLILRVVAEIGELTKLEEIRTNSSTVEDIMYNNTIQRLFNNDGFKSDDMEESDEDFDIKAEVDIEMFDDSLSSNKCQSTEETVKELKMQLFGECTSPISFKVENPSINICDSNYTQSALIEISSDEEDMDNPYEVIDTGRKHISSNKPFNRVINHVNNDVVSTNNLASKETKVCMLTERINGVEQRNGNADFLTIIKTDNTFECNTNRNKETTAPTLNFFSNKRIEPEIFILTDEEDISEPDDSRVNLFNAMSDVKFNTIFQTTPTNILDTTNSASDDVKFDISNSQLDENTNIPNSVTISNNVDESIVSVNLQESIRVLNNLTSDNDKTRRVSVNLQESISTNKPSNNSTSENNKRRSSSDPSNKIVEDDLNINLQKSTQPIYVSNLTATSNITEESTNTNHVQTTCQRIKTIESSNTNSEEIATKKSVKNTKKDKCMEIIDLDKENTDSNNKSKQKVSKKVLHYIDLLSDDEDGILAKFSDKQHDNNKEQVIEIPAQIKIEPSTEIATEKLSDNVDQTNTSQSRVNNVKDKEINAKSSSELQNTDASKIVAKHQKEEISAKSKECEIQVLSDDEDPYEVMDPLIQVEVDLCDSDEEIAYIGRKSDAPKQIRNSDKKIVNLLNSSNNLASKKKNASFNAGDLDKLTEKDDCVPLENDNADFPKSIKIENIDENVKGNKTLPTLNFFSNNCNNPDIITLSDDEEEIEILKTSETSVESNVVNEHHAVKTSAISEVEVITIPEKNNSVEVEAMEETMNDSLTIVLTNDVETVEPNSLNEGTNIAKISDKIDESIGGIVSVNFQAPLDKAIMFDESLKSGEDTSIPKAVQSISKASEIHKAFQINGDHIPMVEVPVKSGIIDSSIIENVQHSLEINEDIAAAKVILETTIIESDNELGSTNSEETLLESPLNMKKKIETEILDLNLENNDSNKKPILEPEVYSTKGQHCIDIFSDEENVNNIDEDEDDILDKFNDKKCANNNKNLAANERSPDKIIHSKSSMEVAMDVSTSENMVEPLIFEESTVDISKDNAINEEPVKQFIEDLSSSELEIFDQNINSSTVMTLETPMSKDNALNDEPVKQSVEDLSSSELEIFDQNINSSTVMTLEKPMSKDNGEPVKKSVDLSSSELEIIDQNINSSMVMASKTPILQVNADDLTVSLEVEASTLDESQIKFGTDKCNDIEIGKFENMSKVLLSEEIPISPSEEIVKEDETTSVGNSKENQMIVNSEPESETLNTLQNYTSVTDGEENAGTYEETPEPELIMDGIQKSINDLTEFKCDPFEKLSKNNNALSQTIMKLSKNISEDSVAIKGKTSSVLIQNFNDDSKTKSKVPKNTKTPKQKEETRKDVRSFVEKAKNDELQICEKNLIPKSKTLSVVIEENKSKEWQEYDEKICQDSEITGEPIEAPNFEEEETKVGAPSEAKQINASQEISKQCDDTNIQEIHSIPDGRTVFGDETAKAPTKQIEKLQELKSAIEDVTTASEEVLEIVEIPQEEIKAIVDIPKYEVSKVEALTSRKIDHLSEKTKEIVSKSKAQAIPHAIVDAPGKIVSNVAELTENTIISEQLDVSLTKSTMQKDSTEEPKTIAKNNVITELEEEQIQSKVMEPVSETNLVPQQLIKEMEEKEAVEIASSSNMESIIPENQKDQAKSVQLLEEKYNQSEIQPGIIPDVTTFTQNTDGILEKPFIKVVEFSNVMLQLTKENDLKINELFVNRDFCNNESKIKPKKKAKIKENSNVLTLDESTALEHDEKLIISADKKSFKSGTSKSVVSIKKDNLKKLKQNNKKLKVLHDSLKSKQKNKVTGKSDKIQVNTSTPKKLPKALSQKQVLEEVDDFGQYVNAKMLERVNNQTALNSAQKDNYGVSPLTNSMIAETVNHHMNFLREPNSATQFQNCHDHNESLDVLVAVAAMSEKIPLLNTKNTRSRLRIPNKDMAKKYSQIKKDSESTPKRKRGRPKSITPIEKVVKVPKSRRGSTTIEICPENTRTTRSRHIKATQLMDTLTISPITPKLEKNKREIVANSKVATQVTEKLQKFEKQFGYLSEDSCQSYEGNLIIAEEPKYLEDVASNVEYGEVLISIPETDNMEDCSLLEDIENFEQKITKYKSTDYVYKMSEFISQHKYIYSSGEYSNVDLCAKKSVLCVDALDIKLKDASSMHNSEIFDKIYAKIKRNNFTSFPIYVNHKVDQITKVNIDRISECEISILDIFSVNIKCDKFDDSETNVASKATQDLTIIKINDIEILPVEVTKAVPKTIASVPKKKFCISENVSVELDNDLEIIPLPVPDVGKDVKNKATNKDNVKTFVKQKKLRSTICGSLVIVEEVKKPTDHRIDAILASKPDIREIKNCPSVRKNEFVSDAHLVNQEISTKEIAIHKPAKVFYTMDEVRSFINILADNKLQLLYNFELSSKELVTIYNYKDFVVDIRNEVNKLEHKQMSKRILNKLINLKNINIGKAIQIDLNVIHNTVDKIVQLRNTKKASNNIHISKFRPYIFPKMNRLSFKFTFPESMQIVGSKQVTVTIIVTKESLSEHVYTLKEMHVGAADLNGKIIWTRKDFTVITANNVVPLKLNPNKLLKFIQEFIASQHSEMKLSQSNMMKPLKSYQTKEPKQKIVAFRTKAQLKSFGPHVSESPYVKPIIPISLNLFRSPKDKNYLNSVLLSIVYQDTTVELLEVFKTSVSTILNKLSSVSTKTIVEEKSEGENLLNAVNMGIEISQINKEVLKLSKSLSLVDNVGNGTRKRKGMKIHENPVDPDMINILNDLMTKSNKAKEEILASMVESQLSEVAEIVNSVPKNAPIKRCKSDQLATRRDSSHLVNTDSNELPEDLSINGGITKQSLDKKQSGATKYEASNIQPMEAGLSKHIAEDGKKIQDVAISQIKSTLPDKDDLKSEAKMVDLKAKSQNSSTAKSSNIKDYKREKSRDAIKDNIKADSSKFRSSNKTPINVDSNQTKEKAIVAANNKKFEAKQNKIEKVVRISNETDKKIELIAEKRKDSGEIDVRKKKSEKFISTESKYSKRIEIRSTGKIEDEGKSTSKDKKGAKDKSSEKCKKIIDDIDHKKLKPNKIDDISSGNKNNKNDSGINRRDKSAAPVVDKYNVINKNKNAVQNNPKVISEKRKSEASKSKSVDKYVKSRDSSADLKYNKTSKSVTERKEIKLNTEDSKYDKQHSKKEESSKIKDAKPDSSSRVSRCRSISHDSSSPARRSSSASRSSTSRSSTSRSSSLRHESKSTDKRENTPDKSKHRNSKHELVETNKLMETRSKSKQIKENETKLKEKEIPDKGSKSSKNKYSPKEISTVKEKSIKESTRDAKIIDKTKKRKASDSEKNIDSKKQKCEENKEEMKKIVVENKDRNDADKLKIKDQQDTKIVAKHRLETNTKSKEIVETLEVKKKIDNKSKHSSGTPENKTTPLANSDAKAAHLESKIEEAKNEVLEKPIRNEANATHLLEKAIDNDCNENILKASNLCKEITNEEEKSVETQIGAPGENMTSQCPKENTSVEGENKILPIDISKQRKLFSENSVEFGHIKRVRRHPFINADKYDESIRTNLEEYGNQILDKMKSFKNKKSPIKCKKSINQVITSLQQKRNEERKAFDLTKKCGFDTEDISKLEAVEDVTNDENKTINMLEKMPSNSNSKAASNRIKMMDDKFLSEEENIASPIKEKKSNVKIIVDKSKEINQVTPNALSHADKIKSNINKVKSMDLKQVPAKLNSPDIAVETNKKVLTVNVPQLNIQKFLSKKSDTMMETEQILTSKSASKLKMINDAGKLIDKSAEVNEVATEKSLIVTSKLKINEDAGKIIEKPAEVKEVVAQMAQILTSKPTSKSKIIKDEGKINDKSVEVVTKKADIVNTKHTKSKIDKEAEKRMDKPDDIKEVVTETAQILPSKTKIIKGAGKTIDKSTEVKELVTETSQIITPKPTKSKMNKDAGKLIDKSVEVKDVVTETVHVVTPNPTSKSTSINKDAGKSIDKPTEVKEVVAETVQIITSKLKVNKDVGKVIGKSAEVKEVVTETSKPTLKLKINNDAGKIIKKTDEVKEVVTEKAPIATSKSKIIKESGTLMNKSTEVKEVVTETPKPTSKSKINKPAEVKEVTVEAAQIVTPKPTSKPKIDKDAEKIIKKTAEVKEVVTETAPILTPKSQIIKDAGKTIEKSAEVKEVVIETAQVVTTKPPSKSKLNKDTEKTIEKSAEVKEVVTEAVPILTPKSKIIKDAGKTMGKSEVKELVTETAQILKPKPPSKSKINKDAEKIIKKNDEVKELVTETAPVVTSKSKIIKDAGKLIDKSTEVKEVITEKAQIVTSKLKINKDAGITIDKSAEVKEVKTETALIVTSKLKINKDAAKTVDKTTEVKEVITKKAQIVTSNLKINKDAGKTNDKTTEVKEVVTETAQIVTSKLKINKDVAKTIYKTTEVKEVVTETAPIVTSKLKLNKDAAKTIDKTTEVKEVVTETAPIVTSKLKINKDAGKTIDKSAEVKEVVTETAKIVTSKLKINKDAAKTIDKSAEVKEVLTETALILASKLKVNKDVGKVIDKSAEVKEVVTEYAQSVTLKPITKLKINKDTEKIKKIDEVKEVVTETAEILTSKPTSKSKINKDVRKSIDKPAEVKDVVTKTVQVVKTKPTKSEISKDAEKIIGKPAEVTEVVTETVQIVTSKPTSKSKINKDAEIIIDTSAEVKDVITKTAQVVKTKPTKSEISKDAEKIIDKPAEVKEVVTETLQIVKTKPTKSKINRDAEKIIDTSAEVKEVVTETAQVLTSKLASKSKIKKDSGQTIDTSAEVKEVVTETAQIITSKSKINKDAEKINDKSTEVKDLVTETAEILTSKSKINKDAEKLIDKPAEVKDVVTETAQIVTSKPTAKSKINKEAAKMIDTSTEVKEVITEAVQIVTTKPTKSKINKDAGKIINKPAEVKEDTARIMDITGKVKKVVTEAAQILTLKFKINKEVGKIIEKSEVKEVLRANSSLLSKESTSAPEIRKTMQEDMLSIPKFKKEEYIQEEKSEKASTKVKEIVPMATPEIKANKKRRSVSISGSSPEENVLENVLVNVAEEVGPVLKGNTLENVEFQQITPNLPNIDHTDQFISQTVSKHMPKLLDTIGEGIINHLLIGAPKSASETSTSVADKSVYHAIKTSDVSPLNLRNKSMPVFKKPRLESDLDIPKPFDEFERMQKPPNIIVEHLPPFHTMLEAHASRTCHISSGIEDGSVMDKLVRPHLRPYKSHITPNPMETTTSKHMPSILNTSLPTNMSMSDLNVLPILNQLMSNEAVPSTSFSKTEIMKDIVAPCNTYVDPNFIAPLAINPNSIDPVTIGLEAIPLKSEICNEINTPSDPVHFAQKLRKPSFTPLDVDKTCLEAVIKLCTSEINVISEQNCNVGGPFLRGNHSELKPESIESTKEEEQTIDENVIFPFSEQLMDTNLIQEQNKSLDNSPVSSATDFQFSEQDSQFGFNLMESNLAQENAFIPASCKETSEVPFAYTESSDIFMKDAQVRDEFSDLIVMSVEKMQTLLHPTAQVDDGTSSKRRLSVDKSGSNELTDDLGTIFAINEISKLQRKKDSFPPSNHGFDIATMHLDGYFSASELSPIGNLNVEPVKLLNDLPEIPIETDALSTIIGPKDDAEGKVASNKRLRSDDTQEFPHNFSIHRNKKLATPANVFNGVQKVKSKSAQGAKLHDIQEAKRLFAIRSNKRTQVLAPKKKPVPQESPSSSKEQLDKEAAETKVAENKPNLSEIIHNKSPELDVMNRTERPKSRAATESFNTVADNMMQEPNNSTIAYSMLANITPKSKSKSINLFEKLNSMVPSKSEIVRDSYQNRKTNDEKINISSEASINAENQKLETASKILNKENAKQSYSYARIRELQRNARSKNESIDLNTDALASASDKSLRKSSRKLDGRHFSDLITSKTIPSDATTKSENMDLSVESSSANTSARTSGVPQFKIKSELNKVIGKNNKLLSPSYQDRAGEGNRPEQSKTLHSEASVIINKRELENQNANKVKFNKNLEVIRKASSEKRHRTVSTSSEDSTINDNVLNKDLRKNIRLDPVKRNDLKPPTDPLRESRGVEFGNPRKPNSLFLIDPEELTATSEKEIEKPNSDVELLKSETGKMVCYVHPMKRPAQVNVPVNSVEASYRHADGGHQQFLHGGTSNVNSSRLLPNYRLEPHRFPSNRELPNNHVYKKRSGRLHYVQCPEDRERNNFYTPTTNSRSHSSSNHLDSPAWHSAGPSRHSKHYEETGSGGSRSPHGYEEPGSGGSRSGHGMPMSYEGTPTGGGNRSPPGMPMRYEETGSSGSRSPHGLSYEDTPPGAGSRLRHSKSAHYVDIGSVGNRPRHNLPMHYPENGNGGSSRHSISKRYAQSGSGGKKPAQGIYSGPNSWNYRSSEYRSRTNRHHYVGNPMMSNHGISSTKDDTSYLSNIDPLLKQPNVSFQYP